MTQHNTHGEGSNVPDRLTVDEVATLAGLHPESVRRAIRVGALPAARAGRRSYAIRVDDAAAFAGLTCDEVRNRCFGLRACSALATAVA